LVASAEGPATAISTAGWCEVRFDQMVESITERVDNPSEAGVTRYVGLEHLDPESLHLRRWGQPTDVEATKLRFWPGDIIYGRRRAYQRKLAVAKFEGICSAHALVVRARPRTVLPEFLPFFMQSDAFHERALEISVGSLSPTINWRTLAQQRFRIPPLDEQRRIAELLWAADLVSVTSFQATQALEILKETVAASLFQGTQADGKPMPCSNLCDEITVGIVLTPAKYYAITGTPALRSLNVLPDRYDLNDLVYLSREGQELHRKSQLREGDVVIVRTGRPGDAAVVPGAMAGFNCIDLVIARPSKRLRPHYLARFLNSAVGRRQTIAGSAGTAQQHMNVGAANKLIVPLVPMAEQDRVVGVLSEVDAALATAEGRYEASRVLARRLREELLYEGHLPRVH